MSSIIGLVTTKYLQLEGNFLTRYHSRIQTVAILNALRVANNYSIMHHHVATPICIHREVQFTSDNEAEYNH